jgi:RNA polymerase sigma-70 factor, ECF subfamily
MSQAKALVLTQETQVIQNILNGQVDEFNILFERYQKHIFGYALRSLNFHMEDAMDVTAETFYKAYANLNKFNPQYKFSSWLYSIAHNLVINVFRHRTRTISLDMEKLNIPVSPIERKIFQMDVEKVLNQLNEEERSILKLFYKEEKSIKEIADTLKIKTGAAKVRLHRAKQKAKKLAEK